MTSRLEELPVRPGCLRLGVVCTYPPRRIGSADDAGELVRCLARDHEVVVCAVGRPGPQYPDEVVAVIAPERREDYRRAGRVLAEYGVDLVLIRHEDGVYGGGDGSYLLDLVHELRLSGIGYLVSLHGVHAGAPTAWARSIAALTAHATRVIVFTERARDVALARRLASRAQLCVLPAGVPDVLVGAAARGSTTEEPEVESLLCGFAGCRVVTSLAWPAGPSPSDELRDALEAIGTLVRVRPEVRYVVARYGPIAPGPDPAQDLVDALGLGAYVRLLDMYLSGAALAALLARTDAYLVVDDPAAAGVRRAVAAGCAVVAPADLRSTVDDDAARRQAQRVAARLGPELTWATIADRLSQVAVEGTRLEGLRTPPAAPGVRTDWLEGNLGDLGSAGSRLCAPLAVVSAGLLALPPDLLTPSGWSAATGWAGRAVRVLGASVQAGPSAPGASRAVLGLGAIAVATGVAESLRHRASVLRTMLIAGEPIDVRGAADIVLGLADDPRRTDADTEALALAAARLDGSRRRWGRGRVWPCFADRLDPGDIHLARAVVAAGRALDDAQMLERGLESLEWLARRAGLSTVTGMLRAVSAGPQWSVEVASLVLAMVTAYRVTGRMRYARWAQRCLDWFHGGNVSTELVYDPDLGACRAGLGPAADVSTYTVEATLAYLAALLAAHGVGLVALPAAGLSRQDLAVVA